MFGFLTSVIIAGATLIGLAILGTVFLLGFKIVKSGGEEGRAAVGEEARLAQELYQGLERLEGRVESLETLLLEREKKGGA
jgi:hypothetical protein